MPHYRLLHLGPNENQIAGSEEFNVDDDESALRRASTKIGMLPLELWQEGRLVARLEPRIQGRLSSRSTPRRAAAGVRQS